MKIIVVVCVYDRFENIRRWIHAWNMCEQMGAKLIIVNNKLEGMDSEFWEKYCKDRGVDYYIRENRGYETGVIQDVITGTILKDEEWDVFFFATDDTIPIKKECLKEYIEQLSSDVGVVCMEISDENDRHIRTSGWCISKETAEGIEWIYNPIIDKEQCYHFEHTGEEYTLMNQIIKMGKKVVQHSSIENSVFWDTDKRTSVNRWQEWHKEFPGFY